MTTLVLYDDARARTFEPFASTRPVSEMVAGFALIRDRWKAALQATDVQFIAGERMLHFDEGPSTRPATGIIPAGAIIANSRCAPGLPADFLKAAQRSATSSLWRCKDQLAAIRLRAPVDVAAFADGTLTIEELYAGTGAIADVHGWWLDEVWDFIRLLPEQLASDIDQWSTQTAVHDHLASFRPPSHTTVLGNHPVIVLGPTPQEPALAQSDIEPHVVLDASAGPIMIHAGSHVRAFTRINGPCYIGRGVNVLGGEITACSVGDVSKVRGEMSNTIFVGHSNKGHDGFVGHSYLGRWVNLGAGTTTSNLKNTYGTVSLWTPRGIRETGMQFLGTLFGDHAKTGIGLRLTTGTVLGAGANVYDTMPPKVVAPFSWGGSPPYATYRADKFVETASRVMARRHVDLSDRARRHIAVVHTGRWAVETNES
jgi:UDP-N-acetylglucosamine diphosphorylase/glucosamine-1-phosphate N-acetyltransferase